jgi:putative FmdB family regulatory protein
VPTYQYACTECGHRHEQVQAFTDPSLTECPSCGGKLRKVYGSVGVVFKGSGFYRTDSRAGAASASPAADKSDSGTSTESKPAAKEAAASTAKATDGGSSASPAKPAASTSNGSASKTVAASK